MKNRESANKSRLRRTARLATLMTDVAELKKKEQELRTITANCWLTAVASLLCPAGSAVDQSSVALHLLESGQKQQNDEEDDQDVIELTASDTEMPTLRPGKRRAVASTLSNTASLTVCASVFGVTVFTSYENGAVDPGTVRGVGRVLHEASTLCGMDKCLSEASMSQTAFVETTMRSWWHVVTSSELVFGLLLNVVSFIVIMVLYRLWNRHIRRRMSK
ncbi:unnamed protein product [Hyaloperonospora brassicae]|uniref:Uncharacterized protein n=1 Tax=Hyaloperonospora brassicae TaxID=162125 RepID=A0AAV0TDU4_HYABA|nr:unnamed protein product [Hyaloperonospora brassicae]